MVGRGSVLGGRGMVWEREGEGDRGERGEGWREEVEVRDVLMRGVWLRVGWFCWRSFALPPFFCSESGGWRFLLDLKDGR